MQFSAPALDNIIIMKMKNDSEQILLETIHRYLIYLPIFILALRSVEEQFVEISFFYFGIRSIVYIG